MLQGLSKGPSAQIGEDFSSICLGSYGYFDMYGTAPISSCNPSRFKKLDFIGIFDASNFAIKQHVRSPYRTYGRIHVTTGFTKILASYSEVTGTRDKIALALEDAILIQKCQNRRDGRDIWHFANM